MKKLLTLLSLVSVSLFAEETKTINLLEQADMSNWSFAFKEEVKNPSDIFSIKDGVLYCTGEIFGYAYTKQEYSNYKLHLEWSFPSGKANSGLFLYLNGEKKVWPNCVECQLMTGNAGLLFFMNNPLGEVKTKDGSMRTKYKVSKRKEDSNEVELGKWNYADVTCKDGNITIYINGLLQNEGVSVDKSGHIGLQSEGGAISFRNVTLEEL